MRVLDHGKIVAEIPAAKLADEAPLYDREAQAATRRPPPLDLATLPEADIAPRCSRCSRIPSIASKNWVYRQYDHMVRAGTMVLPGSDAAVFLVREANKILAATSDCNALYCALDPREGARIAVAEAARNLACTGAVPLAVTDNLNFGNPHKPENFWQLRECVEGLAEGCRAFNTPVTGGNVSLYNESPAGAIDPTPTVGMVGLIDDERHVTTSRFQERGRRDHPRRRSRRRTRRLAFPEGRPRPQRRAAARAGLTSASSPCTDAVRALIRQRPRQKRARLHRRRPRRRARRMLHLRTAKRSARHRFRRDRHFAPTSAPLQRIADRASSFPFPQPTPTPPLALACETAGHPGPPHRHGGRRRAHCAMRSRAAE